MIFITKNKKTLILFKLGFFIRYKSLIKKEPLLRNQPL